ncbi:MAG: anion permease [Candidatus Thorarchaeota archaeon]|nr:MAG: anion permease [Candidatus Thorarchaeota archaeon]
MEPVTFAVLVVFVGTYIAISSEKVNRTAAALLGMGLIGVVLVVTRTSTFRHVVELIEWHTVLFVTAMMAIVTIAAGSGMFQYLAIQLTRPSHGLTKRLFVYFLSFVFVISIFLDTTSTMLIMAPLTIEVCKALEIDFKPFLIAEAVVCNFASIPTIVGAVPNLVIAEAASLDQGLLFVLMMPLSMLLFGVSVPIFLYFFNKQLTQADTDLVEEFLLIDASYMIRSRRDFYLSVIGIGVLVVGFTLGHTIGFQPSMIAIVVAAFLLLLTREWVDDVLKKINWGTVFFLIGLFGLVAALQITGVIVALGDTIESIIGANEAFGVLFMCWVPSLVSAVVDNIPIATILAPIATGLASTSWLLPYVLIFAVNVGGFILPIGAPANILAISLSEKERNPIRFYDFARIATPLGLLMLVVGTGWFLLVGVFGILPVFLAGIVIASVMLVVSMRLFLKA